MTFLRAGSRSLSAGVSFRASARGRLLPSLAPGSWTPSQVEAASIAPCRVPVAPPIGWSFPHACFWPARSIPRGEPGHNHKSYARWRSCSISGMVTQTKPNGRRWYVVTFRQCGHEIMRAGPWHGLGSSPRRFCVCLSRCLFGPSGQSIRPHPSGLSSRRTGSGPAEIPVCWYRRATWKRIAAPPSVRVAIARYGNIPIIVSAAVRPHVGTVRFRWSGAE